MPDRRVASRRADTPPHIPFYRFRRRLSGDFHLSLITLFTVLVTLALLPFVFYRAALGHYAAAVGNAATVGVLLLAFGYSWMTGRTGGARRAIVIFMSLACVLMVVVVGHLPYWTFPTVVANFMLVGWRFAMVTSILMLAAVVVGAPFFEQAADIFSYLAAVVMVGLFSMIFVVNTNFHRDRLSAMVSRDALTGALNRRVLRDDLTDAIARSMRHEQPVAVALLDLDNFKQVNDTQGHEIGDQVLIDLTHIVDSQSRKSDRFYRLGGEEFVLLLDHTDRNGAEIALGKLIDSARAELKTPAGPVTVSIGVAVHRPGETWSEWLARADQAMYRAKSEGKDRVVFAD